MQKTWNSGRHDSLSLAESKADSRAKIRGEMRRLEKKDMLMSSGEYMKTKKSESKGYMTCHPKSQIRYSLSAECSFSNQFTSENAKKEACFSPRFGQKTPSKS